MIAPTAQSMTAELGCWVVRVLAQDYFAGLGGSLRLRRIESAEFFHRADATDASTWCHGTRVAQILFIEQPEPRRITVAIRETLLWAIPWDRHHANTWPAPWDARTGPMSILVERMGPINPDSQYDHTRLIMQCGS